MLIAFSNFFFKKIILAKTRYNINHNKLLVQIKALKLGKIT